MNPRVSDQSSPHDSDWPRGDALDALLERDSVAVPSDLARRVERAALVRARSGVSSRFRVLVPVALAAAAAFALYVALPPGERGGDRDGLVRDADGAEPSDEFLAALPALEAYDVLFEDLDPLEADALFVLDASDELVFDVLTEDV